MRWKHLVHPLTPRTRCESCSYLRIWTTDGEFVLFLQQKSKILVPLSLTLNPHGSYTSPHSAPHSEALESCTLWLTIVLSSILPRCATLPFSLGMSHASHVLRILLNESTSQCLHCVLDCMLRSHHRLPGLRASNTSLSSTYIQQGILFQSSFATPLQTLNAFPYTAPRTHHRSKGTCVPFT